MFQLTTQHRRFVAVLALVMFALAGTTQAATLLLEDDFNDNSLDAAKWNAVTTGIPQNPKSVTETNQRIELEGRGHLNTVQQFDPASLPEDGLRLRGRWTFVSGDDMLQILTRSDGMPAGGYGETNAGLEFRVQASGVGNTMTISGRGGVGVSSVANAGPLNALAGETYDFEIHDDGYGLIFSMDQVGGPKQRTVRAVSTSVMGTNLVSFHNREGGRRSNLDDVIIDSPDLIVINDPAALLQDDFNDNSIDAAKWNVVTAGIPQNPKGAVEASHRMQIEGRAHLNTVPEFDPLGAPQDGIRVRGQWTFVSGDDMLQILTRSDGTPAGSYGETNAGLEFRVQASGVGNTMTIGGRGGAGLMNLFNSGPLDAVAGETYDFEILDDGHNLTFAMQQVGGDKYRRVTADSTSVMGTNLVSFHNREGGRRSNLDNVIIDSPVPRALNDPGALLVDDFNDNLIDPAKWNVVTAGVPQNPKSVTETGFQMEIEGRAHLNTAQQFDPAAAPQDGIRIRGQWTFISGDDFMQILTRTDGTPGGGYGETNNGIEFQVSTAAGGGMTIRNRGSAAVSNVFNSASLGASIGETYDFEIRDDGQNLMLDMRQVDGNKHRTVWAMSNSAMPSNLISFHNREGGRRSNLDNVVIDSPAAEPPLVVPGALLVDDFNDNSLDPAKWATNTSIPQGGVIVRESSKHIELQGRGHLNTAQQFDPAAIADDGLRIRGQWTFLNDADMMQILTRSDGTPGGGYGETNNGIEFRAFGAGVGGGAMTIASRGAASVSNVVNSGSLNPVAGETYDVDIRDDGQYLLFTMNQVGGGKHHAVMAQSTSALATNLITFHNREGSGNRSVLDNVIVDAAPSHVPIFDDFNDGVLDGTKWFTVTGGIPQNPKSITETAGHLELEGRAHLNTVGQYDPLTAPQDGLHISGQWTFVSGSDMLQILTRSDGTPGGSWGETNNGVEFYVDTGGNMAIRARGGAAVTGAVTSGGGLGAQLGETYDFDIRDNGSNLFFTMRQIDGTKQGSMIAASSSSLARNFITFHNREGGFRANLDNVSIGSPQSNLPDFGSVLLQDRFDDNSLDASLWNAVTAGIPQNPKSINEQDQRIRVEGRAHLNTAQEFDPAAGNGLTIRGRWTFQSGDDFMQILTRSDGVPGGSYGETANGIEFQAVETGTTNNIVIRGMGGANVSDLINASQWLLAGETYDFEIVDDGLNLALTMKQVGGPKAAVATATSDSVMATNLIAFHNREGGRVSHLDDVVIVDGTPSRNLTPYAPQGFLVRQATSTGTIDSLADADALLAGMNLDEEATRGFSSINFLDTGGNGLFGNDNRFPLDTPGDDDDFALMATALLMVPEDGNYVFGVNSDDGSRLRIDDMDVIYDDALRGPHNIYGHADLAAGLHELELVYFERNGGAEVELFWYNGAGDLALIGVPEPLSAVLLGLGGLLLAGCAWLRRRRHRD